MSAADTPTRPLRKFRFGYQTRSHDPKEFCREARAAEEAGFDVLHTFDHIGDHFSPLIPLAAAVSWTTRIRLCPLVLNNDLHNPVYLAQELASLDHLSDGRLEVGLGAGHAFPEYDAAGIRFDSAGMRKARLGESIEILRELLDGNSVSYQGEYYAIEGARTLRPQQEHVPMLVGVNGRAALAHAATHADIIGLTMLGRTLVDGNAHEVRWEQERLDDTVSWIKTQAGERWAELELNALVQDVVVTPDRKGSAQTLMSEIGGLSLSDALATPFLALGTHDEIAEHLLACRARWGISYYSVRDISAFAPVIERLRQADSAK